MALFSQMLNLQFTLFLLILIGIIMKKKGIITREGKKTLSDLTVNLILPCNIIHSFMGNINASEQFVKKCFEAFLISLVIQMFSILVGKYFFYKFPTEKRNIFTYGLIVSNSSFIGLPVVDAIYGTLGVLYTSFFQIPVRITMWTAGLSLFTHADRKEAYKKLIKHPCIVAVVIGIILMLLPVKLPEFVSNTIEGISKCTVPVSMLVIGCMLAGSDIRQLFDRSVLYYCLIRLAVYPALVLLVLKLLRIDNLLCGVMVLLNAMPMANTTAILADKYDSGAKLASQSIFVSTLFSMLTLPIWCLIVG
ncbi:MAG: AEC family transporter [Lachnospiraceae bacterium]